MDKFCSPYDRRRLCLAIALGLAIPLCSQAETAPGSGATSASDAANQPAADSGQDAGASSRQAPANPTQLGTVIVTANKRDERLQDVPMAVSVLDEAHLERQSANSFADYATQMPGLNTISSGQGWTQLVLRGITSGSHQPNATVGTYIDDTPYGSSTIYAAGSMLTPDIDPSDIERIEVLRGPQGTLYGSNTLGGLVKFVTTPPDTTQASGRIGVDANSVDSGGNGFGTHAMANIPLIADTLGLRVNAYARTDPGFIDNVNTGQKEVNEAKVRGGRAQLLWTPSEKVSVRFSALAQNLSSDGLANGGIDLDPNTMQPIYGWDKQNRAAGTGMFKVKYRLYDLSISDDMGWATLYSTTSYGTLRLNQSQDLTSLFGPMLNTIFGVPNGGYAEVQPISLNKVTQELRLQSPADQAWEWRTGLFFTREHTVDGQTITSFDYNTGAPIALPTLGVVSVGPAIFKEWAGYGDLTWHATDRFSILVGARYSSDQTTYTQTNTGILTGDSSFTTRGSDHPVTYLFNPSYKFSDDVMAYLRVASGFRPGGANVGVPPGLGAPLTFDPDKLTNYELGLKALMLDRRMSVELNAFYIDWSKVQLTSTAGGFSFLGNGGKATSEGFEASWRYNPGRGLTLWANATYTDAKLAQDNPPGSVYGLKGDPLPYVPKWNANLGVDYNFPMGSWSGFVGGNFSYVGRRAAEFNTQPAPRYYLPGFNDLNLYAGANVGNWTFKVYAKNLANKHGITSVWPETQSSIASPFNATVQTPRTIGVSATVDF
ncbi:TonB-dependent receptor [Dyella jiangningensis]|uniref:TonB-dependent receptor n=1 Tax=Dyella jiangningensis TaxID=1379159 RepID=A0A328P0W8_9GAMM|nr:TonB-dependent receptor [Dyella jiangningensis]RAO75013.1 TonB-dependent receptor [Dyella jiangningensis]